MEQNDIIAHLEHKNVKPTANRILVLKTLFDNTDKPVSLADLERILMPMDKSSIFRTLTLFLEHDITHSFEDGRGVLQYELCSSELKGKHSDMHIHFYCESCHKSFCMTEIRLPEFHLPEGFTPHSASFVIKGECPQCRKKHERDKTV